jgi:hypothetical protein
MTVRSPAIRRLNLSIALLALACPGYASAQNDPAPPAKATTPPPAIGFKNNKLVYQSDAKGNRPLDFSQAGYKGGGVALPSAPVKVTVPLTGGDQTARLQAAIDYVASLQADANGLRGAILLDKGTYSIGGALKIRASGITLRGQGNDTILQATGQDRRALIQVLGNPQKFTGAALQITEPYVPVNATTLHITSAANLKTGATVQIKRPGTKEWIDDIGMFQFPGRPNSGDFRFSWRPGMCDIFWDRTITRIEGNEVTVDAPITTALDSKYAPSTVTPTDPSPRLSNVGIENLRLDSTFDAKNNLDEDHAWFGITLDHVDDSWVSNVTATHFASSLVNILENTRHITVQDCSTLEPISEIGGYRRHAFYTAGQQTLFLRCYSEHARRDFVTGYFATGPTAFVYCSSKYATDFSGTMESWCSGILFDNLQMEHGRIRLDNREVFDQGAGWTAANCAVWNSVAPQMYVRTPPGAGNWAFGAWGVHVGEGPWGVVNEFIDPDSLYLQQLEERLGKPALAATKARTYAPSAADAKSVEVLAADRIAALQSPPALARHPVTVKNGWLLRDDALLTGTQAESTMWKGHMNPQRNDTGEYGLHLTRFAPGRSGPGLTDDLTQLTDMMRSRNIAAFAHHWGLWYDERRQDHQQTRRVDGDVEPPFYEQAWKRAGQAANGEVGYDGLSKYDITQFNPWYFNRLLEFTDLADQKGLLLIDQHLFQHHVLEDAAHWMDVPWRVTNALQDLGLPEPPPIENRKRIFIANIYYDVEHNPKLRDFHRAYIRKHLDTFGDSRNVLHVIGDEYSGPLSFMQFWLDTVAEWEKETGKHPLVALSCNKDVQDAILDDPVRSKVVDVIDMKYWWYTSDGKMYNPPGGEQVAPRKQLTAWKGSKSRSDESTARQIRDYRAKYPDKAIILSYGSGGRENALSQAIAGASLVPLKADAALLAALPTMTPFTPPTPLAANQYALADADRQFLVYSMTNAPLRLDLSKVSGDYTLRAVGPDGTLTDAGTVTAGKLVDLPNGKCFWLTRK